MSALRMAFVIVAVILFAIAAFGVGTGRYSLVAAGLAFAWASTLVPG